MRKPRTASKPDLHITTDARVQGGRVGPMTIVRVTPDELDWLHRVLVERRGR